jgi:hypothetical protein
MVTGTLLNGVISVPLARYHVVAFRSLGIALLISAAYTGVITEKKDSFAPIPVILLAMVMLTPQRVRVKSIARESFNH